MGRPVIAVETLHNYSLEELIKLKNETSSKYTRIFLTVITMRYQGYTNAQIMETSQLSRMTISTYVRKWNYYGEKSLKDNRGNNLERKLTQEIIDDLIDVTLHKSPRDFEFVGHRWTCGILVEYVKQNYDIDVSDNTIRVALKDNKLSYKKAESRPTKGNKTEQEKFKKNIRGSKYFRVFQ